MLDADCILFHDPYPFLKGPFANYSLISCALTQPITPTLGEHAPPPRQLWFCYSHVHVYMCALP